MGAIENNGHNGNQKFLNEWDKYSKSVKDKRKTLLLPIKFGFGEGGKLIRERMIAPDVKKLFKDGLKDIPKDWFNNPDLLPNPKEAVEHYVKYFMGEMKENPLSPPSPLDIVVDRPVLILFGFYDDHLFFSKKTDTLEAAYKVHNDSRDHTRNFFKVATLNENRGLMLLNRHYSNPKGLKFDLHIDIHQEEDGNKFVTPIVIDPGTGNGGARFP